MWRLGWGDEWWTWRSTTCAAVFPRVAFGLPPRVSPRPPMCTWNPRMARNAARRRHQIGTHPDAMRARFTNSVSRTPLHMRAEYTANPARVDAHAGHPHTAATRPNWRTATTASSPAGCRPRSRRATSSTELLGTRGSSMVEWVTRRREDFVMATAAPAASLKSSSTTPKTAAAQRQ